MEVSDEFKLRLAEVKEPVHELFRKKFATDDIFLKAEIQKEIEDILFPFIDELMRIGLEEQFEKFATYRTPIEDEDIFSHWKNSNRTKQGF